MKKKKYAIFNVRGKNLRITVWEARFNLFGYLFGVHSKMTFTLTDISGNDLEYWLEDLKKITYKA